MHVFGGAHASRLAINTSKPITDLSFILAHDSHTIAALSPSVLADPIQKSVHAFAVDQTNSVTLQLGDGVRALRFNSALLTKDNTMGEYDGLYTVNFASLS